MGSCYQGKSIEEIQGNRAKVKEKLKILKGGRARKETKYPKNSLIKDQTPSKERNYSPTLMEPEKRVESYPSMGERENDLGN